MVAHQAIRVQQPAVATRDDAPGARELLVGRDRLRRSPRVVPARDDVVVAVRNLDPRFVAPSASTVAASRRRRPIASAEFRHRFVTCPSRLAATRTDGATDKAEAANVGSRRGRHLGAAHARRRLPRARADRRPPAPHADALVAHALRARRRAGPLQGRAPPAHRLVQAARRPQQARDADRRGEVARRDLDLRRQPRAGARVRVGGRGHRRARRHVADRVADEDRRGARLRRHRRRLAARHPGGVRAPRPARRGDRAHARPSVRRPARDGRPGNRRARDARGRPRRRRRARPGRRRRPRLRHRDRRQGLKPDARVFAIEPELSNALAASMAAGESVTVEPKSIADGLNGPYAGPNCVRVCLDLGVENVLVTEDDIEGGLPLHVRPDEARVRGRRRRHGRRAPRRKSAAGAGDTRRRGRLGGQRGTQTAAAILAEQ